MNNRILILCEGITDQIFIADCIELFYNIKCTRIEKKGKKDFDIRFSENGLLINVGGCTKLGDQLYISMLEDNTELGGINIVIFDADYSELDNGNKGYIKCVQKLESIKANHNIYFEYHIWPNNESDGIVENLLIQLIPAEKENVFSCIESHQDCLRNLKLENLNYAGIKEKINFYLYTVNQFSEARKRDYKNGQTWNLDHEGIQDIKKLKSFFDQFFSPPHFVSSRTGTGQ